MELEGMVRGLTPGGPEGEAKGNGWEEEDGAPKGLVFSKDGGMGDEGRFWRQLL